MKGAKMERRREIFGCLGCEKIGCPIQGKPVKSLLRDDLFLECIDFVEMYETFQEISQRIKQIKEKECGQN